MEPRVITEARTRATVAVTTAWSPDAAVRRRAEAAAKRFGVPYAHRGRLSLEALRAEVAGVLIVFGGDGVRLFDGTAPVLWSAGMAALRIGRMESGEVDTLVDVAGLRPGDQVLDATLGLGQDTLVASRALGGSGRIVALEQSLPLAIFTAAGLATAEQAIAPIEVLHKDAAQYLAAQPDRSTDVVLFDPMFGRPRKAQPAFEMLRRHAHEAPLTPEVLAEAKRVARRCVVVKGAKYSDDLQKLGLRPVPRSRYAEVVWARIEV